MYIGSLTLLIINVITTCIFPQIDIIVLFVPCGTRYQGSPLSAASMKNRIMGRPATTLHQTFTVACHQMTKTQFIDNMRYVKLKGNHAVRPFQV
jgi:hypothetical protein